MKNKTFILHKAFGDMAQAEGRLEKINKYALVPLAEEQVYARRYLMAHNAIDRDVERFNEDLLEDFARTLPGKGFFVEGHPSSWNGKGGPGEGRFYNAYTEMMTPEAFRELTGEEAKLPDNITSVKVLWGESYILRLESNSDTIAKIDAGIYSFTSIGFKAPYVEITEDRGNFLYGEYTSKGEALEGSLVWLGAQPGAMAKEHSHTHEEPQKGGKDTMKEFLEKLKKVFGKTFSEEGAVEEIKQMLDEKDQKVRELTPLAEEGKAYRKSLVDDTIRFGTMIEEIKTDTEEQKKEAAFLETLPIERLKTMREKYEKTAREKFPDKFTFKGKDTNDRQKQGENAQQKQQQTTGKKDYTDPAQNELFATLGK